nr:septal ring lytic transglycosylase RlpA family protein [Pseudomonas sp. EpS/L25]
MLLRSRYLMWLLVLACTACQEKDSKTVAAPVKKEASFEQRGKASFYARKFHGKETASGETFNNDELVAAHKTLPLGTKVKVTNLENDRAVIVRINDRGPYIRGRIIDLSRAAARRVDMVEDGTTPVKVEKLE